MCLVRVHLRLLGRPHVRAGANSWDVQVEKRFLLLAHLACHDGWLERDKLAFLFWPDVDENRARANLRQLLKRARSYPFAHGLLVEPRALRWDVESDVGAFRQALGAGAWAEAVSVYGGELLLGVDAGDGSGLASWLELERETLQRQWREACLNRAEELARHAAHVEAASVLRDVLQRDVLAEDVLQAYLRSALASGQRDEALRLYERFRTQLAEELALEPLDTTLDLVQALGRGTDRLPSLAEPVPPDVAATRDALPSVGVDATPADVRATPGGGVITATVTVSTLPEPSTPLIGLDLELAELAGMLASPACRLVTLTGPGGSGKTRLALEVALERVSSFADGCHFVSLAPLDDPTSIGLAVAERLGVTLTGEAEVDQQVFAHLRDKDALLVLDNLEHLLSGAGVIAELLEGATGVRVLVTSREPIGFAHEVVFDVPGLGYPASDAEVDDGWHETYDAVRLFVWRARRQLPSFRVSDDDKPALLDLCRILQGNPLGLELAAAWVRMLRPAEIVDELRRGIDLLAAEHQEPPSRHRSLRAVFDHSWRLLTPDEQRALAAFSVFRGGASKAAAIEVTGAVLRTLLMLVNKSLLSRDRTGRFDMLEPLRQFATTMLRSRPSRCAVVNAAHARYFAAFIASHGCHLAGGAYQQESFVAIDLEFDNLRAAWARACEDTDVGTLTAMQSGLGLYLERRSRFHEGVTLFAEAHRRLTGHPEVATELAIWLAAFHANVGALQLARSLLEAALAHVAGGGEAPGLVANALWRLGVVERSRGDHDAARRHVGAALARFEAEGDRWGMANALNTLGALAVIGGDLLEAKQHLTACAELREGLGDAWGSSIPLLNLGTVSRYLCEIDQAERHYLASLSIARANGNEVGVSFVLGTLAAVDTFRGAYAQAEQRYGESLAIRRRLGDRRLVANTLLNLVTVQVATGAFASADGLLDEAAMLFEDVGDRQGIATTQATRASRLLQEGRHEEAARQFQAALERETSLGHAHGASVAREGLARVALARGDSDAARAAAREVMAFAHAGGFTQLLLEALVTYAESVADSGDAVHANAVGRAVLAHGASSYEVARRATQLLERLVGAVAVSRPGARAGSDQPFDELVGQLLR